MSSPLKPTAKQPAFVAAADKENIARDEVAVPVKGIPTMTEAEKAKELEAADAKDAESEDILRENPHRFVLFPIKYHEVRRV